jgi:His-Xaa-Ser system radical SAM maturase HxsB
VLKPYEDFVSKGPYARLGYQAGRIPGIDNRVLVTSAAGEHLFLSAEDFERFECGALSCRSAVYDDLTAKQIIGDTTSAAAQRMVDVKLRTKKAFLREGPTLHIFVVTLRCDHSCGYCQVSRQGCSETRYDMTREIAHAAVERMFESRARHLTVEFQGGEPLLAFDRIREIVALIEARRIQTSRSITYTITSTLHHLTSAMLDFFKAHRFQVSTSIDGPEDLHNANRPTPSRDSHARTLAGLARAREVLGPHAVAALTTLTRASLSQPEAIVDAYVRLGFRSIFLRPLSPYGFARRAERKLGYDMAAFVTFYERALSHILALNRSGTAIEEAYAAILLTHILTPYASRYVDLRSPTGAGFGVLVYNYEGGVYGSDESRMLAEMGDETFRLGHVQQPLGELMRSEAMAVLEREGFAEERAECRECVFLPYCGADPVHAHATRGQWEDWRDSPHCVRHMGLFRILFRYLEAQDPAVMRIFLSWVTRRPLSELTHKGAS